MFPHVAHDRQTRHAERLRCAAFICEGCNRLFNSGGNRGGWVEYVDGRRMHWGGAAGMGRVPCTAEPLFKTKVPMDLPKVLFKPIEGDNGT